MIDSLHIHKPVHGQLLLVILATMKVRHGPTVDSDLSTTGPTGNLLRLVRSRFNDMKIELTLKSCSISKTIRRHTLTQYLGFRSSRDER